VRSTASREGRLAAVVALGIIATACGGPAATTGGSALTPSGVGALSGSLTVFAAASLTEAFTDARAALQAEHSGLTITYSFAGSQAVVTQVQNGAPADVVATADAPTMQRLVDGGVVRTPTTMSRNKLEIVVPPGNPKHVTGLSDFAHTDLRVILADASVPAGRYSRQALSAQHVLAHPVSLPLDVRSVLMAIVQGNADAGIVYVTDAAAAGSSVTGVPIPDTQNVIATYPIAVVAASMHATAAAAFVSAMVSGVGQQALRARGFLAP
jgi:molybdate transport system substrate-binding protein